MPCHSMILSTANEDNVNVYSFMFVASRLPINTVCCLINFIRSVVIMTTSNYC